MLKQSSFFKPLVIVPAAGFGRRVGEPNSKEILSWGEGPLIERCFFECGSRGWPLHLLTRPEKTELLAYCERRSPQQLQIQLVGETEEWPATVLLSEPAWQEWNLLFLPDLVFQPSDILDQIARVCLEVDLELSSQTSSMSDSQTSLVAAGLQTDSPHLWGCLRREQNGFSICEKPLGLSQAWAWGFLAFRKNMGRRLFQALLASGKSREWIYFPEEVQILNLESMQDPTRSKST